MLKKYKFDFTIIVVFALFVGSSFYFSYSPGVQIFEDNFWAFFKEMVIILPTISILIGFIDVWIPKERVQRHIGKTSGVKGILLVMLLAFIQAGPLYVAFPMACLLWKKGCSPVNVFIYLSAFTTAKIPMLTFEISFLGIEFSLLRVLITLPVFILIGIIMGKYFENNKCKINDV